MNVILLYVCVVWLPDIGSYKQYLAIAYHASGHTLTYVDVLRKKQQVQTLIIYLFKYYINAGMYRVNSYTIPLIPPPAPFVLG